MERILDVPQLFDDIYKRESSGAIALSTRLNAVT